MNIYCHVKHRGSDAIHAKKKYSKSAKIIDIMQKTAKGVNTKPPNITIYILHCRCVTPHITVFLSFAPSVRIATSNVTASQRSGPCARPIIRLTGLPHF